jgi:predicted nucleotidyltransferase
MRLKIAIDREWLAEFCRQNGIRRLAVFGSALRDDFVQDSDVDVLVEFEPGRTPGLRFFGIQDELSRLFGRTVDLHTQASLSRYFRSQVMSEAEDQYVAA